MTETEHPGRGESDPLRTPFEGSPNAYDYVIEPNVHVGMRDGVSLAADIYRPALRGTFVSGALPVLLERTPYNKGRLSHSFTGRYFARRGYVTIVQDVRGRGASGGEFSWLRSEPEDGFDTLDWIVGQPWCNGRIGTVGISYTGAAAQALAILRPPGLVTQISFDTGYNYHTYTYRSGGACEYARILQYVVFMACTSKEAARDRSIRNALESMRHDLNGWLRRSPLRRGQSPLQLVPAYESWLFDVLTHTDYDEYWKHPGSNLEEYVDRYPDIPLLLQTSWYGNHIWATLKKYQELKRLHQSQKKLLIGTWIHGPDHYTESWAGDVDFGTEAALEGVNDVRLRWFDHHLKGLRTGIDAEAPVKIFVMGGGSGRRNGQRRLDHGGSWRNEDAWPPPGMQLTPYYFHPGGKLLPEAPVGNDGSSSYAFDPRNPVPTIGGNCTNLGTAGFVEGGGFDQRGRTELAYCTDTVPLSSRDDVLVFRTPPLKAGVEVTGPLLVRLWVSSSAVDTDFTAKLIDEYPPSEDYPEGYALNIADAIARIRYRNSREEPEMFVPGSIAEITIEPQATSNYFAPTHSIRVDISSSNFPRFDVDANTGEISFEDGFFVVARQTVYHNAEHSSHIVLPIVRRSVAESSENSN